MAMDSHIGCAEALRQAEQLKLALDRLENSLDSLEPGADPDVVAEGLSDAARALDAAAREVAR